MVTRVRIRPLLTMLALTGVGWACRDARTIECALDEDCGPGFVCSDLACIPGAPDAASIGGDAGDVGPLDTGLADDAGRTDAEPGSDGGARDGGGMMSLGAPRLAPPSCGLLVGHAPTTTIDLSVSDPDSRLMDAPSFDDVTSVSADLSLLGGAASVALAPGAVVDATTRVYRLSIDTLALQGGYPILLTLTDRSGAVSREWTTLMVRAGAIIDVGPGQAIEDIQSALDGASTGDVVRIARGVYGGPRNTNLQARPGAEVIVTGSGCSGESIIDCGAGGSGLGRAFSWVGTGQTRRSVIHGLTLRNCDGGGAIHLEDTNPTVSHVSFANNSSEGGPGGGILVDGALTVAVVRSDFRDHVGSDPGTCIAGRSGGGVEIFGGRFERNAGTCIEVTGALEVRDAVFQDNEIALGNEENLDGRALVRDTRFVGNASEAGRVGGLELVDSVVDRRSRASRQGYVMLSGSVVRTELRGLREAVSLAPVSVEGSLLEDSPSTCLSAVSVRRTALRRNTAAAGCTALVEVRDEAIELELEANDAGSQALLVAPTIEATRMLENRSRLPDGAIAVSGVARDLVLVENQICGLRMVETGQLVDALIVRNVADPVVCGRTASVIVDGQVQIARSTIADNRGAGGLLVRSGTLRLVDSILFGNQALGGPLQLSVSSGSAVVQHSNVGTGDPADVVGRSLINEGRGIRCDAAGSDRNPCVDPTFEARPGAGPSGAYFLVPRSPLVDAGSAQAAALGVGRRTTRVDGAFDMGVVDLGYHYP